MKTQSDSMRSLGLTSADFPTPPDPKTTSLYSRILTVYLLDERHAERQTERERERQSRVRPANQSAAGNTCSCLDRQVDSEQIGSRSCDRTAFLVTVAMLIHVCSLQRHGNMTNTQECTPPLVLTESRKPLNNQI
ncbi:hypothetical protein CHARACLAT_011642 [Characodon lateralis]|uniref:Uncharacterized protein n=1 Tax=Characodon lateralis TaxID=208331 RepID=A0ABU7CMD8_9TELE|nr:hypothetical protein [Characodon lateralis]